MVALLQQRIPIGLAPAYCAERLNEAFRWVGQQAPYIWDVTRTPIAVTGAMADFPLPITVDIGKPMLLYPPSGGGSFAYEITFVPFVKFAAQQVFNQPPPG